MSLVVDPMAELLQSIYYYRIVTSFSLGFKRIVLLCSRGCYLGSSTTSLPPPSNNIEGEGEGEKDGDCLKKQSSRKQNCLSM